MKKIIVPILSLFISFGVKAQCVPGTITAPKNAYILPDSATNFANACPGTYYEQILYIKAAKDTAITVTAPIAGVITADIDSFVVDANLVGLPSYLSVASVPSALLPAGSASPKSDFTRLVIKGDSLACVKVSGTVPSGTAAATLPLTINLRVYTSNLHSTNPTLDALIPLQYSGRKTDTLTSIHDYRIVVYPTPCWPTSVNTVSVQNFELIGTIPNPSTGHTQIEFEAKENGKFNLELRNAIGQVVFTKTIQAAKGINYIPVETSSFSSGVYLYSLNDGKSTISKRMEISN